MSNNPRNHNAKGQLEAGWLEIGSDLVRYAFFGQRGLVLSPARVKTLRQQTHK